MQNIYVWFLRYAIFMVSIHDTQRLLSGVQGAQYLCMISMICNIFMTGVHDPQYLGQGYTI